jgi:hypothetical protein
MPARYSVSGAGAFAGRRRPLKDGHRIDRAADCLAYRDMRDG